MNIEISKIQINKEYESLVPRVTTDEYQTIKQSIQQHGIREPVVINEKNILIDGHTRVQIAKEIQLKEVPYRIEEYSSKFIEKKAVIEYNLHRRQLNMAQRCELGLVWLDIETKEAEERQKELKAKEKNNLGQFQSKKEEIKPTRVILPPSDKSLDIVPELTIPSQLTTAQRSEIGLKILEEEKGKAIEKAADKVGVSPSTLQHYKKMTEVAKTNPSLQKEREDAIKGNKSVNKVFNTAKQIEKREDKKTELKSRPLPEDKFELIYADPPWEYEFSETEKRSLDNQYPQMHLEDICKLPINTTDDAVLFLWATSPKLEEAFKVMKAWGFIYKTNMVWIKDKIGMGYYARQRHELLLIGIKGKIGVPDPANRPDSVIESPRTEHSKKPDMYNLLEKMYPYRKYIEFDCKTSRN